ncbi:prepilin peptidase [soil metagenome]
MNGIAATAALMALAVLASVSDLRTRRIPNALTVTGLGIALALRGAVGVEPLIAGLAGAAIALAPAVPLVALGGLGGGDAKLLAAVGAFVGPAGLPTTLFMTAIVGGAMGAIAVARRGAFGFTATRLRSIVTAPFGLATQPLPRLGTPGAIAVPYGVAISAGALAGWWLP